jgi:ABC-type sugar transport system ATPase subunit
MASVSLQHVSKVFGSVRAVSDLTLHVADGEFLVLLGPSGCGKTTALRMIAGLESISEGTISIGNRVANGLHPADRNVAMVFQSYALYPHMTVFNNLAYGLRRNGLPKGEILSRVTSTAQSLGIESLLQRRPAQLSGGQRQRVALGRAIVRHPAVFLMDEPLSNLDAQLRIQTRVELMRLHQHLGVTTLYVTHDQVEAMTMGQRIVVMHDGRMQQVGPPLELYHRPRNLFVAAFLGAPQMNRIEGKATMDRDQISFACPDFRLIWPARPAAALPQRVILGIRPQHAQIEIESAPRADLLLLARGRVELIEHLGSESYAFVMVGNTSLVVELPQGMRCRSGDVVDISIAPAFLHLFDAQTGDRAILVGEERYG